MCEGQATEINYFNALIADLRLPTVNAIAVKSPHTCPDANVLYAIENFRSGNWDTVFCVFDKDRHTKYEQALTRLARGHPSIKPGYSVPCFEYWLLLHFKYTDRSFYGHPTRSPGECVQKELKEYIPDYSKGARDVYGRTKVQIEQAKKFALQAKAVASKTGNSTSHTLVVDVVQALQLLRGQMDK